MIHWKRSLPFAILLAAFALRAWQLTEVPPGLTHDEAGHGHDAAHILKGVALIYFTVGYGREPLFDYFNAGLIAGLGANPFTLRFSAVIWGLIALAATYRLAQTLFGGSAATFALALMAVSFWQLSTSRQILRSAILPSAITLSVFFYLRLTADSTRRRWLWAAGLALAIAVGLYTYTPARALWLMFPLTVTTDYAASRLRGTQAVIRNPAMIIAAVIAGLALSAPMFIYLYLNPGLDQRLGQLSGPLTEIRTGNYSPLIANAREFLLALFLPGHGDHFLAYTIPGRPVFDPITFLLFLIGFAVILRSAFSIPHSALLLYWLSIGIAPSIITGPDALTTRMIGAQSLLYILSAVGLDRSSEYLSRWLHRLLMPMVYVGLVGALGIITARDYFIVWGQSPDVRAAYQSTLIAMVKSARGPTVISTIYPSAVHDPYIAELFTDEETRWVDARYATILRADSDARPPLQLLAPASTPLHPFIAKFYQQQVKAHTLPNDLDPFFILYQQFAFESTTTIAPEMILSGAVGLQGSQWLRESYRPGEAAELFTAWHVIDPARLGALHPPAFATDLNLFTHIVSPDGSIFLQQDRLDAPSWDWQAGDTIIQIHQFVIPPDAAPGDYRAEVGLYDRITGERLLTEGGADLIAVSLLLIK